MSDRTEKILNMECPCCGNKHQCKMSCEKAESFKAFKQTLIWLPFMTDKQLAEISYECWHQAYSRSGQHLQDELESQIQSVISETNKPR